MADERSSSERVRLWVDLPTPGAATAGALVISGWAFRRGGARIVEVEARVGSHRAAIPQGVHRPDVALALGEPHADWSGFEGTLVVEESATERADLLIVRATDESGDFAEVEVPVRVLPSGRPLIEVEQARWEGGRIEVEGWLIWPEGVAPRRLELLHGETRIAESTPNLSRPDVARRFPAFPLRSCRGFRLSGALDPLAAAAEGRAQLRVVCTDARRERLEQTALVARQPSSGPSAVSREGLAGIETVVALVRERVLRAPLVLDWHTGLQAASFAPEATLFQPASVDVATLPYADGSLDLVVTDASSPERRAEARRVAAVATLEGGALRWQPFAPPRPVLPETSIVFPAHGRAADVDAALRRVRETLPRDVLGEVLVVDDQASDDTSALLRRWAETWPLVRILRTEERSGYFQSCNRGAELAKGELLVFLDGGALPCPGWLPPLLRSLLEDRSVGAVGGKLLNADGTLRAAGGVLFADGTETAFGQGDGHPNRPLYSFVRDVDCCSSALLAIRRATFLALGGFDPRLGSSGFGDAEVCLRLRQQGYRIRYQPASAVVIGGSALPSAEPRVDPTDRRSEERKRFTSRWQTLLRARPETSSGLDLAALHTLSAPPGARRVLICAPRLPEYDRESGSLRLFHLAELLQQAGWAVSYLALKSVDGERYLRILQQRGVAAYAGPDSMLAGDEYVDDVGEVVAEGRFDLAILAFWSVAEKLLPQFRSSAPATRVIVDSVDLHYLREERAVRSASRDGEPVANLRRRLDRKARELDTYAAADVVMTVSTKEAEIIAEETGRAVPVVCVPDMEELAYARRGFRDRSGLLFIGNFNHPPNLEGLEYLCAEILPRLDPELLAAHPLSVVGNGVNDRVRAAAARLPGASVVGWVPSVVPYLERALVSLIPLLHGAGTKRKLVQALMVGTPSVSTSIGTEGLDLEHGRQILVADSAEEFAAGIRRLATDPMLWNTLAREGRSRVEIAHGREAVRTSLLHAVERASGPARANRSPALARD